MAYYIVMVFVVIALAWIVGWALTDKDGWLVDESEPWEWREKEDEDDEA